MIDNITKDKIIETAQIVDVVQDFVSLKKRGANHIGLCPFHNEKTPSFSVSASKGIFKCFGCGKGGNAVSFVMEHEQMSYYEALKYLAKKYGIQIEERELTDEERKLSSERESLMIVSAFALRYFQNNLLNSEEGIEVGLSYLKERGYGREIIEKFKLGYCSNDRDLFTREALKAGYKIDMLEKSGLTIVKNDRKFDRFSGRVIFPILSLSGKAIGFGGRTLRSDKKIAKYLNSPESPIYSKSNVLYGLYESKSGIVKNDKCYLVEGYTDVISFHASGIDNVVASSGTSLTEGQIRLIKRFTNNITVLFDGDAAGIQASIRSIDMILAMDMDVRVVLFPDGEDPDSYANKLSSSEMIEFIKSNEEDFIKFKTKLLQKEAEKDPLKKASLITDIVKSIASINNNVKEAVYTKECSKLLDIDEKTLAFEISKIKRKRIDAEKKKSGYKEGSRQSTLKTPTLPRYDDVGDVHFESLERELIRLILLFGNHVIGESEKSNSELTVAEHIINELRNDELELRNLVYIKIFSIVEELLQLNKKVETKVFTNHQDDEVRTVSADICSEKFKLSKIWKYRGYSSAPEEDVLDVLATDLIVRYKLKQVQEIRIQLNKRLREAVTDEEKSELIKQINTTNFLIRELGTVQKSVIIN